MLEVGKKCPPFKLAFTGETGHISAAQLKGQKTVLYFYPKDATPGCTQEGQDFSKLNAKFKKSGTQVLGLSRDSLASHEKFKTKQKYTIDLISDPDEVLCKIFDVIKTKNMYGKKVRGIERSTFVLDEKLTLRREWRKVKVEGHATQVLEYINTLLQA